MQILGKLNHYHPLGRSGRYTRALISHAVCQERQKSAVIKLKPETSLQLHWCVLNLRALSYEGARIRDVKNHLGVRALDLNGDAVGGAT